MLVEYIRGYQKTGKSLAEAVDRAISRCVKEDILKEYLLKKKSEVKLMLLTEFDEEIYAKVMKEEGREEGEGCINQLNTILIDQNRFEDLKRASRDRDFQKKLIRELLPERK